MTRPARATQTPWDFGWRWETGSQRERAEWIRAHRWCLNNNQIRALFNLTTEGIDMIMRGDDWLPEYEAPDVACT